MQTKTSERRALITFAKEPKEGRVKTRLLKSLSAPTVTRLYQAFIKDVLTMVLKVDCEQRYIYYTGGPRRLPFLKKFKKHFKYKRQLGKTLGDRMYGAFRHCQSLKFDKIVIIGTDCLSLTEADIDLAFRKLSDYDCVLGPSWDGGYYLIGLKEPLKNLFEGFEWSTSKVLQATIQRAKGLKKRVFLMKEKEDIDTAAALQRHFAQPRYKGKESVFTTQLLFRQDQELKKLLKQGGDIL